MTTKHLVLAMLALSAMGSSAVLAQSAQGSATSSPAAPSQNGRIAAKNNHLEEDGQRVFEQNCSRCHESPSGFSPRISGTVVRHMRVRASLSKQDEEALRRFFNP